jgi:hypothetical protein
VTRTTAIASFARAGIVVPATGTKKYHTGKKGKQSYFFGILHHDGFTQGFNKD